MTNDEQLEAAGQIMAALYGTGTAVGMTELEIADLATLAAMLLQADVHGPRGGLERVKAIVEQSGERLRLG